MVYKIILGIPAMSTGIICDQVVGDDEDVWCDFAICQDLSNNKFYFEFETMLGFDNKEDCKKWIKHCLDIFTEYMNNNNLDTSHELDMYSVFTDGVNVNSDFDTLEDAYTFMKFVVNGFQGQGMFTVKS